MVAAMVAAMVAVAMVEAAMAEAAMAVEMAWTWALGSPCHQESKI